MRSLEELAFIRDRVLEHIRTHPPQGPLLTERTPREAAERCQRGHEAWIHRGGQRRCAECDRMRQRVSRTARRQQP